MRHPRENDICTLKSQLEILNFELAGDEAWFKISGIAEFRDGEVPDDSPAPKNVYIGPFSIYDFDL